jgi:hypothetical protein
MKQGEEALNASSLQFLRIVKTLHHFITTIFTPSAMLHCHYFLIIIVV